MKPHDYFISERVRWDCWFKQGIISLVQDLNYRKYRKKL